MTKSLTIATCIALTAALSSAAFSAEPAKKLQQAFKTADKDNDGSLDREEAKSLPRVAKNFDQIDVDKSNTVTLDEIYASMKKVAQSMREEQQAKFQAADKDKDGTLDRNEAKAFPRVVRNFDQIDADKDGTISQDEIRTYARAHRADGKSDGPKN